MNNKRLTRSKDHLIGGVCGGIAEYLDIDPTVVRVGYAFLTLFGLGLIAYPILFLIMTPNIGEKRLTRSNDRILGGVCGGIAEFTDISPTVIRIIYVIFSVIFIFTLLGLILYILFWIIIPSKQ